MHFIEQHWEALSLLSLTLAAAFIGTFPPKVPASAQDWWDWIRAFLLEVVSQRSGRLSSGAESKVSISVPASTVAEETSSNAATFPATPTK